MGLFSGEVLHGVKETSVGYPNGAKIMNSEVITVPLTASSTSAAVFIADNDYQIMGVSAVFKTASSSGALNVEVRNSGTAAGSGTAVLTSTLSLAGTADTIVSGTPTNINTATVRKGQIIGTVISGTMTSLANALATITLTRL